MADSNPASELDSASELPDDVDVAASVGDDIFADGLSEQPFERARLAGAENDQLGPWSFAIATIAFSGSPWRGRADRPVSTLATRYAHLQGLLTGATGLEPATSGVTGRYGLNRYSRPVPRITG